MHTFILPLMLRKNTAGKKSRINMYYQHVCMFGFCKIQMSLGGTKLVKIIKTDNDESISDYLVRPLWFKKKKSKGK